MEEFDYSEFLRWHESGFICRAFDSWFNYQVTVEDDYMFAAEFVAYDLVRKVAITSDRNEWTVAFSIDEPGTTDIDRFKKEIKIFSTFHRIVLEFMNHHNPRRLTFLIQDQDRIKLYRSVVQGMKTSIGNYSLTQADYADGSVFFSIEKVPPYSQTEFDQLVALATLS